MISPKQIPDGGNYFQHFLQYQNDYFHSLNLHKIRNRKNQFIFHKPSKSQVFPIQKKKPMETVDNFYFKTKNNQYLGDKLLKISTRKQPTYGTDLFTLIEKKKKFNESIRNLQMKKIQEDNMLFRNRLMNTQCNYSHKDLENEFRTTKLLSRHLKKIRPLNEEDTKHQRNFSNATFSIHHSESNKSRSNTSYK